MVGVDGLPMTQKERNIHAFRYLRMVLCSCGVTLGEVPDKSQEEVYQVALESQSALSMIHPGITA